MSDHAAQFTVRFPIRFLMQPNFANQRDIAPPLDTA
jgi:hypothetical protein